MNTRFTTRFTTRFIATSDWQLGMAARFLGDEARARFHQARFDAIKAIGQLAQEQDAKFVVVCGDVFEDNYLHRRILLRTFDALRSIKVPVYLIPGNHDPLDAAAIYDSPTFITECPENVVVVRDQKPIDAAPGVQLVGVPWHTKFPDTDLVTAALQSLGPANPNGVRVLAAHGAVSSLAPDKTTPALIDVATVQEALSERVVDLVVLGDKHSTTEVADRIWYSGAPEVTDRVEVDAGNVLLVEVSGEEIAVKKHRVGKWHFTEVSRELDSLADVERLRADLAKIDNKETTALWFSLRGALPVSALAVLDEVLADAGDLFAHAQTWQRHWDITVAPQADDTESWGLTGYAAQARDRLRERAQAGDPSASLALTLLYRLAVGAK